MHSTLRSRNPKGRDNPGDLGVNVRTVLTLVLANRIFLSGEDPIG
jgi:hypothetical protein